MLNSSGRNEVNKMTQRDMVREHLYQGYPITPAKAMAEYGIWRLAAVIHKLREEGLPIRTINKRSLSGKKYAEYRLVKPDEHPLIGDESDEQCEDVEIEVGDIVKIVGSTDHFFPIGTLAEVTGGTLEELPGETRLYDGGTYLYDCKAIGKPFYAQFVREQDLELYAKGSTDDPEFDKMIREYTQEA